MSEKNNNLRKAAILLAALDAKTADEMLEKLDPEQEQQMRLAVVELGDVDPQEQRRVIDEFMRVGPMVPKNDPPGVELAGSLATRGPSAKPFRFLHEAENDRLARVLMHERPQTIAVVLSHLPPDQAGDVLSRMDSRLQVDVIQRLVDLEETDPEILRELEDVLQPRFAEQINRQRRRKAGLSAVDGIIKASQPQVGSKILENLAASDRKLASKLAPPAPPALHIDFDGLCEMDDKTLATVFEAAGPELAMLAMLGASERLVRRVLSWLPRTEAANVRQKLDHPDPVRLRDIEAARDEIAELAERLHREGRINLEAGESVVGRELEIAA